MLVLDLVRERRGQVIEREVSGFIEEIEGEG